MERSLKEALCKEFVRTREIERAYLVRVDYGNPDVYEVALCIKGPEDARIVRRVGDEFAKLFGADEHLDTITRRCTVLQGEVNDGRLRSTSRRA